jgi:hypothetical protein
MPPSRSRDPSLSLACGSAATLPLVTTTGRASPSSISACSGVVGSMKPSVESPGDVFRQAAPPVGAQEHDRRRRAAEKPLLFGVNRAIAAHDLDVGRHQRERLPLAALQLAQARYCLALVDVAGEVNPPIPLTATISPFCNRARAASTSSSAECWSKLTARPSKRIKLARGPQS